MKIVMFEDLNSHLLYPLTYLRPVFDLRCGALSLRQKVQEKFPDCELHLETRDVLAPVARDTYGTGAVNSDERVRPDDDVLLVNAGAILTSPPEAYSQKDGVAATKEGDVIWVCLKARTAKELPAASAFQLAALAADRFKPQLTQDILIKRPWDLVRWNASQIESDFASFYGPRADVKLDPAVAVWGDRKNLHVADDAEVQPCTFIDCRHGPVIIETGAVIRAHTSIEGPAFIGRNSQLLEAKIREGTSIGPVCRVGGEVEESIIHAHSNKYHTGFLGHSYVCEWVNMGALTTNSDLKNDYTNVSVYLKGKPADTGMMKVGSFIGDHTKTSIGTLLNTGSVVGIMCNLVAGQSVLPKYIPSFCWYLDSRISKGLGLAQSLETARAAMARRGVELTDAMVRLIKYTEELTRAEKMERVKRDRRRAIR
jgi:UDP-N-acetylglucosamine diphosphorylase/glucosamine-1-phosphate N-acetyltransferase